MSSQQSEREAPGRVSSAREASRTSTPGERDISVPLIALLRGVLYRDQSESAWQALRELGPAEM